MKKNTNHLIVCVDVEIRMTSFKIYQNKNYMHIWNRANFTTFSNVIYSPKCEIYIATFSKIKLLASNFFCIFLKRIWNSMHLILFRYYKKWYKTFWTWLFCCTHLVSWVFAWVSSVSRLTCVFSIRRLLGYVFRSNMEECSRRILCFFIPSCLRIRCLNSL
jgi:hypothetical protein